MIFRKKPLICTAEKSEPNEERTGQKTITEDDISGLSLNGQSRTSFLGILGAAVVGLIFAPAAAAVEVATASPHVEHLYHMVDDKTMHIGCVMLGSTFAILTVVSTGRFIMSL